MSPQDQLNRLRREMDELNREMLDLLSRRGTLAVEIGKVKRLQGVERYDPVREREMLDFIAASNPGPFETARLQHLFKEMFKASAELQGEDRDKTLLVSRKRQAEDTIVTLDDVTIGNGRPQLIAGPCAVESFEQVNAVAEKLALSGVKILRGGAYKPRTSPYDFQGLGFDGLQLLKQAADRHDLRVISTMTPSAPTASAALAAGSNKSRRPVEWVTSTMTGKCVSCFKIGTAVISSVLRVARSYVRIPRSHKMTWLFPLAMMYSAA